LEQPHDWARVVSLEAGIAMVVTDLHGDWDTYARYRDRFLTLNARGQADYLIFTGDLIHGQGEPYPDRSLEIVLDILALRATLGERLIYLLGNHELPHIYGIILQKGEEVFTPPFEAALGEHRAAVISLFESLPFYVRTRAGVAITHAGAAAETSLPGAAARVFDFSHRQALDEAVGALPPGQRPTLRNGFAKFCGEEDYDTMARTYLAVSGPDDPRYDDLLIGFMVSSLPGFELLWAALFTGNEEQYGKSNYAIFLDALLRDLSQGFHRQEVLITGHIPCRKGYELVARRQLRLTSGPQGQGRSLRAARYLRFDVESRVQRVDELLPGLESIGVTAPLFGVLKS
jgi:hypothetical protein